MLENHNIKNKEKLHFYSACYKVQSQNDEKCIQILNNFNKHKKKVSVMAFLSDDESNLQLWLVGAAGVQIFVPK
jgi:hypothetical protein